MLDLPQKLSLDANDRARYKTKRRVLRGEVWTERYAPYPVTTPGITTRRLDVKQATWTRGNNVSGLGKERYGSRDDIGGYFQTVRQEYKDNVPFVNWRFYPTPTYSGPVYLKAPDAVDAFPTADSMSLNEAKLLGATAISQVLPTNSTAEVATFLGETLERLPSIVGRGLLQSRFRDYREYGNEYLNIEFGWKPFVSDLQDIARSIRDADEILGSYRRNSGVFLRREFHFPHEESEVVISGPSRVLANPVSALGDYNLCPSDGGYGVRTITEKTERDVWLSAAFTYSMPLADSFVNGFSRYRQFADKLLGVDPDLDTLWNLAPWSWMFDWFTNANEIVKNFTALHSDNLVMPYAYLMETKKVTRTHTMTDLRPKGGGIPSTLFQSFSTTRKTRFVASPYGFGFNWDGLSPRQLAILAALGISRGHRK